jgi:hypothetical protein
VAEELLLLLMVLLVLMGRSELLLIGLLLGVVCLVELECFRVRCWGHFVMLWGWVLKSLLMLLRLAKGLKALLLLMLLLLLPGLHSR